MLSYTVNSDKIINDSDKIDLYFFSKNNYLEHKKINCFKLSEIKDYILQCYMVVFDTEKEKKDVILNELGIFCEKYNNYGPIVKIGENDVIFFPQLRYQDGLLIKNILINNIKNEIIDVMFGNVLV